jgi:hypothetical protein
VWLAGLCIALSCSSLGAQQTVQEDLPQPRYLAAALADPASRLDTLLSVTAVARLLEYGSQADPGQAGEIEERFRDERAWLDHLAGRFSDLRTRTALLDPAAWYLQLELDEQQLAGSCSTEPMNAWRRACCRRSWPGWNVSRRFCGRRFSSNCRGIRRWLLRCPLSTWTGSTPGSPRNRRRRTAQPNLPT